MGEEALKGFGMTAIEENSKEMGWCRRGPLLETNIEVEPITILELHAWGIPLTPRQRHSTFQSTVH
jgi:hypothetical protein